MLPPEAFAPAAAAGDVDELGAGDNDFYQVEVDQIEADELPPENALSLMVSKRGDVVAAVSKRIKPLSIEGRRVEAIVCRYNRRFFGLMLPCNFSASGSTVREVLEMLTFGLAVWMEPVNAAAGSRKVNEPEPTVFRKILARPHKRYQLGIDLEDDASVELRPGTVSKAQEQRSLNFSLLANATSWRAAA